MEEKRKINFDDIVFGIIDNGDSRQVIMNGKKGERELMDEIGAQLAITAIQHKPFEGVLRMVVKALDVEREELERCVAAMNIDVVRKTADE